MAEPRVRVPGVEARAGKFPGPSLIPALNAIQERVGWLPREELVTLSHEVHRPLYEIEGLISFYPHFRTAPPKPVELRACHDLSCWLRGGDARIRALRERYAGDEDIVRTLCEGAKHRRACVGRERFFDVSSHPRQCLRRLRIRCVQATAQLAQYAAGEGRRSPARIDGERQLAHALRGRHREIAAIR